MELIYDTGGREKYYQALNVKDCVVRAIAIANQMDYKVTYNLVKKYNGGESAVAVIDGVIHDTYNFARDGSRKVYGYWIKPE